MIIHIFIFLLGLLSLAPAAYAQPAAISNPPQSLIPDAQEGETAQDEQDMDRPNHPPIQTLVVPPSALQPTTPAVIAAPHREDAVEKNELAAPVLTSYGILDETSGALPMDIWKSYTYPNAIITLTNATQAIAAGNGDAVFRNLVRSAALSKTYEPSGDAKDANAYFTARVFAAQVAGDRDSALQLLAKRPEAFGAQEWQSFIDNDLVAGHIKEACNLSGDKLKNDVSSYAQKLGVVCDLAAKQSDAARLHLDVLREGGEKDVLFLELVERAANPKAKLTQKLENLSALHLAVLAVGANKPKPEMLENMLAHAQILSQPLGLDISASDVQRLKLAEQFARTRQINASEYTVLLESIKYPAKAIAQFRINPAQLLTVPEKEWPAAMRRAASLRAMAEEENTAQKAHILAAALPGYSNADILGALGDLIEKQTAMIAPLPDHVAAAPMMARFLLLRGDKDSAAWWRMASAMPSNREAMLPLFPLALLRGALSDDDRGIWFENYSRSQNFSSERKNANLALVKALGLLLPSNIESQLAANNVFPALTGSDKTIAGILSNLSRDTADTNLRAVLALKAMRQDKLAEMLVLLKL